MENEVWMPIGGYEGLYDVSSLGRVKSKERLVNCAYGNKRLVKERILSTPTNGQNRCVVSLHKSGIKKTFHVEHLVAEAFLGEKPEGHWVLHNNGNSLDNSLENLRYGTAKENSQDRIDHGMSGKGEKNPNSRLSLEDVIHIKKIHKRLCPVNGTKPLSEKYKVDASTISAVVSGKNWSWVNASNPMEKGEH